MGTNSTKPVLANGTLDLLRRPENYLLNAAGNIVTRVVTTRHGEKRVSKMKVTELAEATLGLGALFDFSWLRAESSPSVVGLPRDTVRIADLFSGCGLMTLGAVEACRALQLQATPKVAVDFNREATAVYGKNYPDSVAISDLIESVLTGELGDQASNQEKEFCRATGQIDLLLAGPPCQGHSDLNNHTRRSDPKNALLLKVVRAAELLMPKWIVMENVRGIRHDRGRVVDVAVSYLRKLGYRVDIGVLRAEYFGVAQRRHRFFIVATRGRPVRISDFLHNYGTKPRSFEWAAGDLQTLDRQGSFDTPSLPSPINRGRMSYLFRNDMYELPNCQRPDCHKFNSHSYKSVYGRMHWDQPSQTITTGYGSMGQGRFVHPKEPRTITPHEAARLQFVPDYFNFGEQTRGALAEMIGNGVPPKLTYLTVLEALR